MSLDYKSILDLVALTQEQLGKFKFTEIATTLQNYVAMNEILRKERVGFQSGHGIVTNVMVSDSGAAKHVGAYEEDVVVVGDVMQKADIPWRNTTTNYAIERVEIAMNRKPSQIVELVKVRRTDAMIALTKLMETAFWSKPADSTDILTPYGIPYWIVKNSSTGFNGGNPSGFSSGAGNLSSVTYPQWRNYTAQYTNITTIDLVRKWRRAARFTDFKPAVSTPDYNTGTRYGYYTNYDVLGELEEVLEAQNDNLGNNIASKDGKVQFRRVPVTDVPELDSDSTDPVYGINWGVVKPIFLSGEWLNEMGPRIAPLQHKVMHTHIDLTWNVLVRNRRLNFVLSK